DLVTGVQTCALPIFRCFYDFGTGNVHDRRSRALYDGRKSLIQPDVSSIAGRDCIVRLLRIALNYRTCNPSNGQCQGQNRCRQPGWSSKCSLHNSPPSHEFPCLGGAVPEPKMKGG